METIATDRIGINTKTAKKILIRMAQTSNPLEVKNPNSDRLYKDELILCLCGIPGPEIEKMGEKIDDTRKLILQNIIQENPWLIEANLGTL
jgi:hypothetical protein